MKNKIICEQCGAEMNDYSSEGSIHVECPKCGWGWATTTYDASLDDETAYEIWLEPGNVQSSDILRMIANIASVNYLQAKKLLSSDEPVRIYTAHLESVSEHSKVQQIQKIARQLTDAQVKFHIVPDFSYTF